MEIIIDLTKNVIRTMVILCVSHDGRVYRAQIRNSLANSTRKSFIFQFFRSVLRVFNTPLSRVHLLLCFETT